MRKKTYLSLLLVGMMMLGGCQATPEESAVASKAGGLSEEVIAEPLKEGETQTIELPKQWTKSEEQSSGRAKTKVDLPLESLTVGNLPVIEVKNHVFTEKELQKYVEYFAEDEKLYAPEVLTKEEVEYNKELLSNGKGFAGAHGSWYLGVNAYFDKAIEIAPEEQPERTEIEKAEFAAKETDAAWLEIHSYYFKEDEEELEAVKKEWEEYECYFAADVGKERDASIEARQYTKETGKTSSFSWNTGDKTMNQLEFQSLQDSVAFEADGRSGMEYYQPGGEYERMIAEYTQAFEQETIAEADGQKQAEQILEDLGIEDMKLLTSQKALWFPKETFPELSIGGVEVQMDESDVQQAKAGYEFTFTDTAGGIPVDRRVHNIFYQPPEDGIYNLPFDVETVTIVVTEDGVQSFVYDNMAEVVDTVAENTNLLPFEKMEEKIFEQIYYRYAAMGQPVESKTEFTYEIIDVKFRYTYITAYEKPEHAWLVPAWFVTVAEDVNDVDTGKQYVHEDQEFLLNALDGGLIFT